MNEKKIYLTIPGAPYGKGRPRMTRRGMAYTPKKTVNYETRIKEIFAVNYPDHTPWLGPVAMTITAFFPIPKSTSKKLRKEREAEETWYPHRIDGDNLWKICADALNKSAYNDDAQIVWGTVQKFYSARPRVEIELEEF